jgi:hypothetical protein
LVLLLQGDEGATFFHRVAGYGFGKFAAPEQRGRRRVCCERMRVASGTLLSNGNGEDAPLGVLGITADTARAMREHAGITSNGNGEDEPLGGVHGIMADTAS